MAIAARIATTATTIMSSIKVNPLCFIARLFSDVLPQMVYPDGEEQYSPTRPRSVFQSDKRQILADKRSSAAGAQ